MYGIFYFCLPKKTKHWPHFIVMLTSWYHTSEIFFCCVCVLTNSLWESKGVHHNSLAVLTSVNSTRTPKRCTCLQINDIELFWKQKLHWPTSNSQLFNYNYNYIFIRFEDLRIRRVKKEGRKKPAGGEKSAPKDGRSDKIASLLFTVVLETEHGEMVQSVKSRPISLSK